MIDRGPLIRYELIWKSGHVEEVLAHQVLLPPTSSMFGEPSPNRVTMHGEIEGHWQLILDADYGEVATIRNLGPVGAERPLP